MVKFEQSLYEGIIKCCIAFFDRVVYNEITLLSVS